MNLDQYEAMTDAEREEWFGQVVSESIRRGTVSPAGAPRGEFLGDEKDAQGTT